MNDQFSYILIFLAGVFTMAGGIFNWNWFMNNSRARLFVWLFGRDGARVVYVLLGFLIMVGGLFLLTSGDTTTP